jgi:hypothetical protein
VLYTKAPDCCIHLEDTTLPSHFYVDPKESKTSFRTIPMFVLMCAGSILCKPENKINEVYQVVNLMSMRLLSVNEVYQAANLMSMRL